MAQTQAGPSDAGWEQRRLPRWVGIVVMGRNPRATLARVAVLIITSFGIFKFILLPIRVEGISMLPNYPDRSWNLVNRFAYVRHEPQRGDVISIRLAGLHVMYLKRIIGLPGETVAFENGRALINGAVLDEPYVKWSCNWDYPPVKLGPGEYFVVGDNRTMPWQVHELGRVGRDHIVGKLLL